MSEQPREVVKVAVEPLVMGQTDALMAMECDLQVATAHRYPRSIASCQEGVLALAGKDQKTAEPMTYCIKRGGKLITGPSIHFAKVLASEWANIRVSGGLIRVEEKVVVCRGLCWDLERNVAWSTEVTKGIMYSTKGDRAGQRFTDDMIVVTTLAAISTAQRNAVFKTIPEPYWGDIYKQVVLIGKGTTQGLDERRTAMIGWFKKKGVTLDTLLKLTGVGSVEELGVDEVDQIRGMAQAIKDGDTSVKELLAESGNRQSIAEATAAMTLPEPGDSATTTGPTGTFLDEDAQAKELIGQKIGKRAAIMVMFNALGAESQKRVISNCSLHTIDGIEDIGSLNELQEVVDAIQNEL